MLGFLDDLDDLYCSKLLVGIFRVGFAWKLFPNMFWWLAFQYLRVAKTSSNNWPFYELFKTVLRNLPWTALQSPSKASKLDFDIMISLTIVNLYFGKNNTLYKNDFALRAASILGNHDFPFCWCCRPWMWKILIFGMYDCFLSHTRTPLLALVWASGVCQNA